MMRREHGYSMIELLVAITLLLVGILAAVGALDSARTLTAVAERQTSMAHRAQQELERVQSLPYAQIGLKQPLASVTDPYYSAPAGSCPATPGGAAPTYQWDHKPGGSTATESLVVNSCTYGGSTYSNGVLDLVTCRNSDGQSITCPASPSRTPIVYRTYDYVTYTADPNCSGGTICPATTNNYKRITIVVTQDGAIQPSKPALLSTYVVNPSDVPQGAPANSAQNPVKSPTTTCGSSNPCNTALTGTPVTYFPTDCAYNQSCAQPSCSGNNLHLTLLNLLGTGPGAPDGLSTSVPVGNCSPQLPCFALDVGCAGGGTGGGGVLNPPPTDSSTCGSPPGDNKRTHVWVAPGIPNGSTVNLNGTGAMTLYLQSASAAAVNATVCVGLFIAPGGLLGSLTGNLLATQIGVAAKANVTAAAGVPSPVSFNFNVGQAAAVSGNLLGQAYVEVVVWLAASGGTAVDVGYDQVNAASQVTLMTT